MARKVEDQAHDEDENLYYVDFRIELNDGPIEFTLSVQDGLIFHSLGFMKQFEPRCPGIIEMKITPGMVAMLQKCTSGQRISWPEGSVRLKAKLVSTPDE